MNNCTSTIGSSGAVNTFNRLTTGIRAINSVLTVNNCAFNNNQILDWEGFGTGIGIWASRSSLTLQNIFSNNASCTFTSNRRAIRSDGTMRLVVRDAIFTDQRVVDIEVVGSTNAWGLVEIMNNTMNLTNPSENSILLERSGQGGLIHTRVQSNIFNLPPGGGVIPTAAGIRFVNVMTRPGALDQAVFVNNQITCQYGNPTGALTTTIDGIYITGVPLADATDGYQLSGNVINYTLPTANPPTPNNYLTSVGIGLTGVNGINNMVGPNNQITASHIPGSNNDGFDSWLRCGVHINGSMNAMVCRNDADDARHDYHFLGVCSNIEFGRNKVRDATFGLEINGAVPNGHNHRLNEWVPGSTYTGFNSSGVTMLAADAPGLPQGFSWLVDNSNGDPYGYMPPSFFPNGINGTPIWFAFQGNNGASGTPICDAAVPPPGGFGEPPTGHMANEFLHAGYGGLNDAVAAWDFERNLLMQMIRFPNSFSGNSEAEQYYADKVNTDVWNFATAGQMLHEAAIIPTTTQASLDQLTAGMTTLTDSLSKVEQWESADTTTAIAAWQTTKGNLLSQLHTKQVQFAQQNDAVVSTRLSNLETVRTFVADLPQTTTQEKNTKLVLILVVKQQIGEAWTNTDSLNLRAIAYSCPLTGGEAVTAARGMLPPAEAYGFRKEGDDPYCSRPGERAQANTPALTAAVWPNPATETLTVAFSAPFSGTLQVINAAGATVRSAHIKASEQTEVDLASLPNGLYTLMMQPAGQSVQTQRFVILR